MYPRANVPTVYTNLKQPEVLKFLSEDKRLQNVGNYSHHDFLILIQYMLLSSSSYDRYILPIGFVQPGRGLLMLLQN